MEAPRRDLDPEARGHDFLELVRLVEDDDVVFGEHGPSAGQVGSVEMGVDHDDVGRGGAVAGGLGEALPTRGAIEGPGTLTWTDAEHAPGPVRGLEVEIGTVAPRRRERPGDQAADLFDQTLGCRVNEGVLLAGSRGRIGHLELVGHLELAGLRRRGVAQFGLDPTRADFGHPLPADVVTTSLEDREGEGHRGPESGLDQGQVLSGQLVLQRLGRRRYDHLLAARAAGTR